MKKETTIKVWCFRYKDTKELEPFSDRNGINHTRWQDGFGIFGTKKELMENVFDKMPFGLEPAKIELKVVKGNKI